jgi:acetylglutamate kinase
LDLNKDGIVDESEMAIAKQKIEELEHNIETKSLSGWWLKKVKNQINSLKSKVGEEDETKTY